MRRSLVLAGAALAATAATSAPAAAQGSAVMTHGSCATALGASGVASPCSDGSAVLYNPAAIATLPGAVGIGATAITTDGAFTFNRTGERIEREEGTAPVPFGFATYRINDRFSAGLGVYAPYGLGLDWPIEFEGRFNSYDTDLRNIYIQPTAAFRAAPWLAVGAGLTYVRASIEINQRLDLATTAVPTNLAPFPGATFGNFGVPLGTDFADAKLAGDGTGLGFHAGVQLPVHPRISVGARYLSEVEIDYEGDAEFESIATGAVLPNGVNVDQVLAGLFQPGQTLAEQSITTNLTLPAQFTVGVALRPVERVKLVADYQWTGWDSFDETLIDFSDATDQPLILDYQNTDTYRVGAEVQATGRLVLRGGFIYNTAAQKEFSVSPLLPEAERNYYSAGLGYQFGNGLALDLGYQLVDQSDRLGRVRGRAPNLSEQQLRALNVGVYEAEASVLNVTLSYRFGGR